MKDFKLNDEGRKHFFLLDSHIYEPKTLLHEEF